MANAPIRIVEGDARILPGIPPESIELIVTSPPYPMIPQWDPLFERLGALDYGAMHQVLSSAWQAAHRVLVDGGILAVVVGDALRSSNGDFRLWPNHATITEECVKRGFEPLPYVLWQKPTNKPNAFLGSGFLPPNAYVTLDCEFVLLFRKGGLRRFPPKDSRRRASEFTRGQRDRWFSQIWNGIRGASQGPPDQRTGAFPPQIPDRLVRMFSCLGETVLDPFAGTGTTLWSANRWGRAAVGVEIDPDLAEALRVRAQEVMARPAGTPAGRRGDGRAPPRPRSRDS